MSGKPVTANVQGTSGVDSINFTARQSGEYQSTIDVTKFTGDLRIEIAPGAPLANRVVDLNRYSTRGKKFHTFYLGLQQESYSYAYLRRYKPDLAQGLFDRAVAAFTVAFQKHGAERIRSAFDIDLRFHYAGSLKGACLVLGYKTCEQARSVFIELRNASKEHREILEALKINIDMISQNIHDIDAGYINQGYALFLDQFARKDYELAGRLGVELLDKFDNEKMAFELARLSKDRLREDIGTAYARLAIEVGADTDASKNSARKAVSFFREIAVKSDVVARNIRDLEARF